MTDQTPISPTEAQLRLAEAEQRCRQATRTYHLNSTDPASEAEVLEAEKALKLARALEAGAVIAASIASKQAAEAAKAEKAKAADEPLRPAILDREAKAKELVAYIRHYSEAYDAFAASDREVKRLATGHPKVRQDIMPIRAETLVANEIARVGGDKPAPGASKVNLFGNPADQKSLYDTVFEINKTIWDGLDA